jgi:hypothetical protein
MRAFPFACGLILLLAVCEDAYATCGTRGGPGYRSPNGKCVSWQEIGRVCGSPPSTRCTAENVAEDAEAGAGLGKDDTRAEEQSAFGDTLTSECQLATLEAKKETLAWFQLTRI